MATLTSEKKEALAEVPAEVWAALNGLDAEQLESLAELDEAELQENVRRSGAGKPNFEKLKPPKVVEPE